jgi:hypothetical protein
MDKKAALNPSYIETKQDPPLQVKYLRGHESAHVENPVSDQTLNCVNSLVIEVLPNPQTSDPAVHVSPLPVSSILAIN